MSHHIDEKFDTAKDDMALCSSNEEALLLAKQYPTMTRFLAEPYRYYLYTVSCRKSNTFPNSQQLWRHNECTS